MAVPSAVSIVEGKGGSVGGYDGRLDGGGGVGALGFFELGIVDDFCLVVSRCDDEVLISASLVDSTTFRSTREHVRSP